MDLDDLKKVIIQAITKCPTHASEIEERFYLAKDEIENGESMEHEIELAMDSLDEILNNVKE